MHPAACETSAQQILMKHFNQGIVLGIIKLVTPASCLYADLALFSVQSAIIMNIIAVQVGGGGGI